jgi:hypothetical protein
MWTIDTLNSHIKNKVKESVNLDYKSSDSLEKNDKRTNEISKDVSAFANSAGGIIIYGIIEEDHLPVDLDKGVDPSKISKEWLEQVINSRIQRKIDGITIHQINSSNKDNSNVYYVVEIPQSNRAPHQAFNKKFYKRYNFMSEAMEEYEVRDVSRRHSLPDLVIQSSVLNKQIEILFDSKDSKGSYGSVDLELFIVNFSQEPADYLVADLLIPSDESFISNKTKTKTVENKKIFRYIHGNSNEFPIFDGLEFQFVDSRLKLYQPLKEVYEISWRIHGPSIKSSGDFLLTSFEENGAYKLILKNKE